MCLYGAGLDIGYVPAGPGAFCRWSGQFGPQQLVRGWLLNNLIIGLCANCRFMQIVVRRASLVLVLLLVHLKAYSIS